MDAPTHGALREQETEYRAIFEASSDGLVINDAETGLVVEANPAFCRMHGYDRMVGLHPTSFIHPNSHHLFADYVRTVRDGAVFRGRAQDVRKDGTLFDVEVLGRGFTYQGRFALLGVVRDVTLDVQAYQVLEQRVAERTREIDRRRQVAEVLRDLLATVNSGRALDEILREVLAQGSRLLESDASALYLLDPDGTALDVHAVHPVHATWLARRIRVGLPVTGLAALKRRPVAFTDLHAALRGAGAPDARIVLEDRANYLNVARMGPPDDNADPRELRRLEHLAELHNAVLAVPLLVDGQPRGTITMYYDQAREFGDEELRLATAFADQAALAIENARLRATTQERTRELDRRRAVAEGLRELLAVVNSGRGLPAILDSVLDQAGKLLHSDAGAVYLLDSPSGALRLHASQGHARGGLAPELHMSASVTGLAVGQRRAIVCSVLAAFPKSAESVRPTELDDRGAYLRLLRMGGEALTDQDRTRMRRLGRRYRTMLCVPLATPDETYGAISLFYRASRDFADEEVALAFAFADQAALAIENARLHAQSERQLVELDALYRADETLHRSLRLGDVLQALVDVATDILHSDKSTVLVWDADHRRLIPGATRGFRADTVAALAHIPGEGITGLVARSGQPIAVSDTWLDPRVSRNFTDPEGIRALIHAPVLVDGAFFGVFGVHYCAPHDFSGAEERILLSLAQRAALAIQNARLYEQAQQAATLEERQRLARELHDAVTQTLFSTALIAEVIPDLWDVDPADGRQRLEELRRLTRGALAEMRTLLVELRPGALTELPLDDLLRQLGAATAGRSRLEVAVEAEGPRQGRLPPEVQVTLYRIAQEALNNIARHAQARHASVHLKRAADGVLRLKIEDDGRGFDPAVVPPGHLGIRIMRERAEASGATLRVASAPGAGTQIEVGWRPREGGLC